MKGTVCASWAAETDLPDSCDLTAVKPATLTKALRFASDVLYNLTGQQWPGECTDTVRPCRGAHGFCDRCGWGAQTVTLPGQPVISIDEVLLNGDVVDPAWYTLRDNAMLAAVRQPDGQRMVWPCCQDLSRPSTEQGTFEISYTFGGLPDQGGVLAAALLGWEFAVSWTPDCSASCRLPQRVQTITRGGVSMTVLDPLDLFDRGRTGVPDVDMWLMSKRQGRSSRAQFVDPARSKLATRQ